MTLTIRYIITLLISVVLLSCEGYRVSKGTIIDSSSNLPLDSVMVNVITAGYAKYTDSSGEYYVENSMGSCVNGCDDIKVEFSKEGYITQTLKNDNSNGIITLISK